VKHLCMVAVALGVSGKRLLMMTAAAITIIIVIVVTLCQSDSQQINK